MTGGQGSGNNFTKFSHARGVIVDLLGKVYVVDYSNHRLIRWYNVVIQGSVAIGGNGQGTQPNQLNNPEGLSFNRHGNLYAADRINNRIQRFSIEKS